MSYGWTWVWAFRRNHSGREGWVGVILLVVGSRVVRIWYGYWGDGLV